MPGSTRQTTLVWLAVGALAIYSVGLALVRIYQIDEAQNLYMARIIAKGESGEFFTTGALHLLPLAWLATHASNSAELFTAARLTFVLIFWFNIALLSTAAGGRVGSASGAWVLVGAATLAPMWDYGFEIRHENVLLCGLLLIWIIGRPDRGRSARRMAVVGAITAMLHFVAFKATLYTLPASALLIALPYKAAPESRLRLVVSWSAGVLAGTVVVRLFYGLLGAWDVYTVAYATALNTAKNTATDVMKVVESTDTLLRLPIQTPLLLAGVLGALIVCVSTNAASFNRGDLWTCGHAEALLLLVAFAAFLVNPTPFPYNLLLLVPFLYLLVVRVLLSQPALLAPGRGAWPWIIGAIVFTHLFPFAHHTRRHLALDNARQVQVMTTAEALTDPERDRVYDATGLVVSRRSIHRWWYLHSLSARSYGTAEFPRLATMLTRQPAAVLIKSYRTDWLPAFDQSFIDAHYVPLADDLWVLGTAIAQDRSWECLHGGRYELKVAPAPGAPAPRVLVNGTQMLPGVHRLARAKYDLGITDGGRAAIVWIGPRLATAPSLSQQSHSRLFVNWY
jgi:hypothetical protein